MTLDWDRWHAMRASLDYCWVRMVELQREGLEGRAEYETVVQHAMTTADRLLQFSGAPRLSTPQLRALWQTGRGEVMELRERISEAGIAQVQAYENALAAARSDD